MKSFLLLPRMKSVQIQTLSKHWIRHFASSCPCPLYEDAALAQMFTDDYLQTSYNIWGTLGHVRGARFCNEYLTDEEKEKLEVDFYLTRCESQHWHLTTINVIKWDSCTYFYLGLLHLQVNRKTLSEALRTHGTEHLSSERLTKALSSRFTSPRISRSKIPCLVSIPASFEEILS